MAVATPPDSTKLPFWSTLGEAFLLPMTNPGVVFRLTWAWAALLAIATGVLYRLLDDAQIAAIQRGDAIGPVGLNLLSILIGLIVGSSVAVGWHRFLLLGETSSASAYLRLDNTVWGYIAVAGLMLLISMPFLAGAFIMGQIAPDLSVKPGQPPPEISGTYTLLVLGLFAGMIAAFLLTTRLSLVLPSRAIDDTSLKLSDSWRLTSGSFWRLFAGTLICYLPALIVGGLLGGAAGAESSGPGSFIMATMLSSVAGLMTSVFPLAYLSLAYKHFTTYPAAARSSI